MSSIHDSVREAIRAAIAGAEVTVTGGGGHFQLVVTAPAFEGKGTLERHRLVLGAIAHLMGGDDAPVHAIDSITTRTA